MHTDEAVHAIKFGALLENNDYKYDPYEYHGPALNYFTSIPAWLSGASSLEQVSEIHLRIVPVFFGLLLILGYHLLVPELGRAKVLAAALLTAVSPAFVFYSRYYIQEMLFVCFSFFLIVGIYKFVRQPRYLWAIVSGIALGLSFATKETCVISFAAITAGLGVIVASRKSVPLAELKGSWTKIAIGLLAALAVSVLFYSSFFTNPRGVIDSLLTYKIYLTRGTGGHQAHLYPWYYYFKWLLFNKEQGKPLWSEFIPVSLGIAGMISAFVANRNRDKGDLLKYLSAIAIVLFAVYSIIPYKTPWSILGGYQVLLLIAGVFAVNLIRNKGSRVFALLLLVGGTAHLFYQSVQANGRYSSDDSNPYVYAHTSSDIYKMVARVDTLAFYHKLGKELYIEVVCSGADYWPLPWYLRPYPNVGYWSEVSLTTPPGEIILAQPVVEQQLLKKMFELPPPGERHMYLPLFEETLYLRPSVELRGYVRKDLYDNYYYGRRP